MPEERSDADGVDRKAPREPKMPRTCLACRRPLPPVEAWGVDDEGLCEGCSWPPFTVIGAKPEELPLRPSTSLVEGGYDQEGFEEFVRNLERLLQWPGGLL
jgi:hypothetical protein